MPLRGARIGFPATSRLRTPVEFTRVFRHGFRLADTCFNVYALRTEHGSRLGLAVSKKSVGKAVNRNRVKRTVRESFRHWRPQLPDFDIVVQARPGVARTDSPALRNSLEQHWQELIKRCAAS